MLIKLVIITGILAVTIRGQLTDAAAHNTNQGFFRDEPHASHQVANPEHVLPDPHKQLVSNKSKALSGIDYVSLLAGEYSRSRSRKRADRAQVIKNPALTQTKRTPITRQDYMSHLTSAYSRSRPKKPPQHLAKVKALSNKNDNIKKNPIQRLGNNGHVVKSAAKTNTRTFQLDNHGVHNKQIGPLQGAPTDKITESAGKRNIDQHLLDPGTSDEPLGVVSIKKNKGSFHWDDPGVHNNHLGVRVQHFDTGQTHVLTDSHGLDTHPTHQHVDLQVGHLHGVSTDKIVESAGSINTDPTLLDPGTLGEPLGVASVNKNKASFHWDDPGVHDNHLGVRVQHFDTGQSHVLIDTHGTDTHPANQHVDLQIDPLQGKNIEKIVKGGGNINIDHTLQNPGTLGEVLGVASIKMNKSAFHWDDPGVHTNHLGVRVQNFDTGQTHVLNDPHGADTHPTHQHVDLQIGLLQGSSTDKIVEGGGKTNIDPILQDPSTLGEHLGVRVQHFDTGQTHVLSDPHNEEIHPTNHHLDMQIKPLQGTPNDKPAGSLGNIEANLGPAGLIQEKQIPIIVSSLTANPMKPKKMIKQEVNPLPLLNTPSPRTGTTIDIGMSRPNTKSLSENLSDLHIMPSVKPLQNKPASVVPKPMFVTSSTDVHLPSISNPVNDKVAIGISDNGKGVETNKGSIIDATGIQKQDISVLPVRELKAIAPRNYDNRARMILQSEYGRRLNTWPRGAIRMSKPGRRANRRLFNRRRQNRLNRRRFRNRRRNRRPNRRRFQRMFRG